MIKENSSITTTIASTLMTPSPRDGYDLPLYGIENTTSFYMVHIPALTCISLSLSTVVIVLFLSCRGYKDKKRTKRTSFYNWNKGERFVIYLCICDGLFNSFHLIDHVYIMVIRKHVTPPELCRFYGFMLVEFIGAQIFMVNLIAINAFLLIYFRKNIDFGKYDHRLVIWTFGMPCIGGITCLALNALGPNGIFCFFDGVKGVIPNLVICSAFLSTILFINITLYGLTYHRIRKEEFSFKRDENNEMLKASHRAARSMSLFVAAFMTQWWAMALYGIWQLTVKEVPLFVFQLGTTFSNLGGVFNGVVYFFLRRQRIKDSKRDQEYDPNVFTPDLRTNNRKAFNYELVNNSDKSNTN
eukprot:TCONS_00011531-protein